jgi:hypothetical protein
MAESTFLDDFVWRPSTCFIRRPWRTSCQNKTFIGVSETYDFIVTIPEDDKIEYIMAQDGSVRLRLLGSGKI